MSLFLFSFYIVSIANSVYCNVNIMSNRRYKDENTDDLFVRVKRNEVDLQTCIDNFDVHKDKIIRTQDSRDMGAKYLNEIDLGSREECLRLCCETDKCDVFVFEEKSPGSCYLFHCGPPEDFKCKFTRHVNYTSAVLALNRHNELENQIKMTKHEQDLTRLRKPEDLPALKMNPSLSGSAQVHTTIRPVQLTAAPRIPLASKEMLPVNVPKHTGKSCSRYQFECRSTSECIAIYNACDGIPQCSDGSDEAPELGCPASTASVTAVPPSPHQPQRSPSTQQRIESTNHETRVEEPDAHVSAVVAPLSATRNAVPRAEDPTSAVANAKPRPAAFQNYDQSNPASHYQHSISSKTVDIIPPKTLPLTSRDSHQLDGSNNGLGSAPQNSREDRPMYDRTSAGGGGPDNRNSIQIPPPRALPVSSYSESQLPPLSRSDLASGYQSAITDNSGQQNWMPHQFNQMPPNYNPSRIQQNQMQYTDQNSRIFNHKLNGIQVADPLEGIPNMPYGDGGSRDLPKLPGYYNSDTYRPQMPIPDSWQGYSRNHDGLNSPYMAPDIRENWQSMQIHMMNRQGIQDTIKAQIPVIDPDVPSNWKLPASAEKADVKIENEKQNDMPLEDDENKKKSGSTESNNKKVIVDDNSKHLEIKNKTVHHNNSHKHHTDPVSAELKMSEEITIVDIVDGEANKPSGAILSLTLGLCLTSIMIVIVGCRLRVVRRRMRKGGKSPYAHDADYLVNGMYL